MTLDPNAMRASASGLFSTAKRFYAFSLCTRAITFATGLITAFTGSFWGIPILLLALAGMAEGFAMTSDARKGRAEDLMRRVEFWDGFGWSPSDRDLRQVPVSSARPDALYFASEQGSGPVRAMENLEEQAWWSRELFRVMEAILAWTLGGTLIVAVVVLLIVAGLSARVEQQSVKLVIATLNIGFSFGLVRLYTGYRKAAEAANAAELNASELKTQYAETPALSPIGAVRAYHAYQLARSSAPLIPDTIYARYRHNLNARWDQHQTQPPYTDA